jgi:hypothetical protein
MHSVASHFKLLVALGFVLCVAVVSVPFALAGYYFDDQGTGIYCIQPGQAAVSGSNSWGVNAVRMMGVCTQGTNPQMGLSYMRPDGSTYSYVWASCNCIDFNGTSFSDPRDISYGRAICKANSGNGGGIWVDYCWVG